jgi:hypothetical protein
VAGSSGVDPKGREFESCHVDVGSGESEGLTELVAADDGACEAVRTPQKLGHQTELSISQGAADAGAAHDFGSDMDGSHGIHRESQFSA